MEDVTQIVKSGEDENGWIGLSIKEMGPESEEQGVIVTKVDSNSPSDNAAIEAGDIIKRIGNLYIHNIEDYKKAKNKYKEFAHITLQIKKRTGSIIFVAVKP